MRIEIIISENVTSTRKLSQSPQKDGSDTEYACGLLVIGSWASRLQQHQDFLNTPIGKYILKLES